jgi:hypothetical protein
MADEEEDFERADVSVLLLPDEAAVVGGIDRTLRGLRRPVHAPIVVGYQGRDKLFGGFSERVRGHMFAPSGMDA